MLRDTENAVLVSLEMRHTVVLELDLFQDTIVVALVARVHGCVVVVILLHHLVGLVLLEHVVLGLVIAIVVHSVVVVGHDYVCEYGYEYEYGKDGRES